MMNDAAYEALKARVHGVYGAIVDVAPCASNERVALIVRKPEGGRLASAVFENAAQVDFWLGLEEERRAVAVAIRVPTFTKT